MSSKSKARRPRKPASRTQERPRRTREPSPRAEGRYTPPTVVLAYFRPAWHKVVGLAIIVLGLAIITINYLDDGAIDLFPGGHQEGYFFLGIVVAATGTWWLGLFDPPT